MAGPYAPDVNPALGDLLLGLCFNIQEASRQADESLKMDAGVEPFPSQG
jgi:hypothetical protein